jgi:membrane-anchored protein YejM (alkaline phosphatase superfamily)
MFWYSAYNLAVTLLISAGFYSRFEMGFADRLMALTANLSHWGLHWTAAGCAFWLVARVFRRRPGIPFLLFAILSFAAFSLLWWDMKIYQLYRYHLNGLVWQATFGAGALGESVRLGTSTIISIVIGVAVIISSQLAYLFLARPFIESRAFHSNIRIKAWAIGLLALVVLADKLAYSIDKLYNNTGYVRFTKAIPLYHPASLKKFAVKYLGYKVDSMDMLEAPQAGSLLAYPPLPAGLPHAPATPLPNILLIIPDGMRWDMVDEKVMPRLAAWTAKNAWRYQNHFSNGNTTEMGFFALFYGFHGSYWSSFLAERRGPVLVDLLKKLGYQFRLISSTTLNFPELSKTAFVAVNNSIADRLGGTRQSERDGRQPGELFRFLDGDRDRKRPFFSVMYFDSTHAPYDNPPEFTKFHPIGGEVNFLNVTQANIATHLNRYKNGLFFLDSVIGRTLDGLEKRGLLGNTVVVILGDHGEEFWESGYYGHTDAFTVQQCRTAFIAHWPGRGSRTVREVTQHFDLCYTIFELLGYPEFGSRYTLGASLLKPKSPDYWTITGYYSGGIYTRDRIITFNYEKKNRMEMELRDWTYKTLPIKQQKDELKKYRPFLLKTLEEQVRFYR